MFDIKEFIITKLGCPEHKVADFEDSCTPALAWEIRAKFQNVTNTTPMISLVHDIAKVKAHTLLHKFNMEGLISKSWEYFTAMKNSSDERFAQIISEKNSDFAELTLNLTEFGKVFGDMELKVFLEAQYIKYSNANRIKLRYT